MPSIKTCERCVTRPYPTHGEPIAPLDLSRQIDEWAAAEVIRVRRELGLLPRIPKTLEQLDYEDALKGDWTWR